jgi:hypothetical protein
MAKKQTKTQRINAMLVSHPELSAKEIAKRLNVSANLVYQVKWQTKKNSEFVSKVFDKVKLKKPTPERSDDPKVIAAENKYIDAAESLYEYYNKNRPVRPKLRMMSAIEETNRDIGKLFNEAYEKYKDDDAVNHPPHYRAGGIETIDFIEAKDLNYRLGNVVKYVSRAGKKGTDPVEDLKKALWYLNREINVRENA